MKRALQIISGFAVVTVLAAGYYLSSSYQRAQITRQQQLAKRVGIVSEHFDRQGDEWKSHFVARLPASETAVFGALEHFTDSPKPSLGIKAMKTLYQDVNRKTVEVRWRMKTGRELVYQTEYGYFPQDGRVTCESKTPLGNITAEWVIKRYESGGTEIDYKEILGHLRMSASEAAIDRRGAFIALLEVIRQQLSIDL
jgi:hypothetical protein